MEQFRIAIVEDETPHAELLKQHIESWQKQQGMVELHVRHFCHASAFFFDWEEACYDMIFLDIQMPGINGMEMARKIRETDSGVKLVFTTGITDYLEEGYEVEAIRYLIKPITREKVWQCLDKLLQEPAPSPQHIFQTQEGVVKISEQEIEYLEARGHYTVCHLVARASQWPWGTADGAREKSSQGEATVGRQAGRHMREGVSQGETIVGRQAERHMREGVSQGEATVGRQAERHMREGVSQGETIVGRQTEKHILEEYSGGSITERSNCGEAGKHMRASVLRDTPREILLWEGFNTLCDRLSQRPFARCHRSYLCNIAYIHRVGRTDILLESGDSIPVSRRMYESVVKAFISYFRRED